MISKRNTPIPVHSMSTKCFPIPSVHEIMLPAEIATKKNNFHITQFFDLNYVQTYDNIVVKYCIIDPNYNESGRIESGKPFR